MFIMYYIYGVSVPSLLKESIDSMIIMFILSWHHKDLGIYGLGVAQAPRLVMNSAFKTTRMCTEHVETLSRFLLESTYLQAT